jgi:hypothetical protein
MSVQFNSLTHALRRALIPLGVQPSLGHTHQLVAAAFGYQSKAAWESLEPKLVPVAPSTHWLVDNIQLASRATTLDLQLDLSIFAAALAHASQEIQGPSLFNTTAALEEVVAVDIKHAVLNDIVIRNRFLDAFKNDLVVDLVAAAPLPEHLPSPGEDLVFMYVAEVGSADDLGDHSLSHSISVTVEARLPMLGRRVAGTPSIRILETEMFRARAEIGMQASEAGQYINVSEQNWDRLERGYLAGTPDIQAAHKLLFEKLNHIRKAPHHSGPDVQPQSMVAIFRVAPEPVPLSTPIDMVQVDNFLGIDDEADGWKVMKSLALNVHTRHLYVHRTRFDPVANRHVLRFAQQYTVDK